MADTVRSLGYLVDALKDGGPVTPQKMRDFLVSRFCGLTGLTGFYIAMTGFTDSTVPWRLPAGGGQTFTAGNGGLAMTARTDLAPDYCRLVAQVSGTFALFWAVRAKAVNTSIFGWARTLYLYKGTGEGEDEALDGLVTAWTRMGEWEGETSDAGRRLVSMAGIVQLQPADYVTVWGKTSQNGTPGSGALDTSTTSAFFLGMRIA